MWYSVTLLAPRVSHDKVTLCPGSASVALASKRTIVTPLAGVPLGAGSGVAVGTLVGTAVGAGAVLVAVAVGRKSVAVALGALVAVGRAVFVAGTVAVAACCVALASGVVVGVFVLATVAVTGVCVAAAVSSACGALQAVSASTRKQGTSHATNTRVPLPAPLSPRFRHNISSSTDCFPVKYPRVPRLSLSYLKRRRSTCRARHD
jgi:hypothetical protein